MNKTILMGCMSGFLMLVSLPLHAEDLMQVYQQALTSDPTFKKAESDWLATQEELAIAKSGTGTAGSGLFPFVDLSGELNRTYKKTASEDTSNSGYYNGSEYFLTVTQPIFNYATWKSISSARYVVKAGAATYMAAEENLMFRVAQAYFNVLNANDTLHYTSAQKRQFLHQLITAEQKFKVGLIAITGVYDAKASYDSSIAQAISDRNALLDQLENLRAITGRYYTSLKGLKADIPLVVPKPASIEKWVELSLAQNYTIKSAQNTLLSDRELIKEAEAGRYPDLVGVAAYGAETTGTVSAANTPDTVTTSGYVSLNLDIPIFQGGYVSNTAKQAEYNYLSASDSLDFTHRDVMNHTRQSFWGVQSGISKIQADQQSINSARNQLEATEAGYTVGTRTMVDVLDSVTALYQSQEAWSDDRYSYIINLVTLKEQAGTLSPADLKELNVWLAKEDKFNLSPVKVDAKYNKVKLKKVKRTLPGVKQPKLLDYKNRPGASLEPQAITKEVKETGELEKTKPALVSANQSKYYSIQLYSGYSEKGANSFLKSQPRFKKGMQVVSSNHSGRGWYRVLYGQYETRTKAQAALDKAPTSLKQLHPWVVLMLQPYHKASSAAHVASQRVSSHKVVAGKKRMPAETAVSEKSNQVIAVQRPTAALPLAAPKSTDAGQKLAKVALQENVPSLNNPEVDQRISSVRLPVPAHSTLG